MLGVRSRGGLYAVLSEQISIDQAIVETGQKNFYFLDAEPHIPNPADIIVSHRFAKLVKALSAKSSTSSLMLPRSAPSSMLPRLPA